MKWHRYFLDMLEGVGAKSPDPHTQVAAIFVDQDHIIRMTGYNGLPRKVLHLPKRLKRPEKYKWMVHAERNGITNAARAGISLKDTTLYTNGVPCRSCTMDLVNVGIREIVMDKDVWENWWKGPGEYHDKEDFFEYQFNILKEVHIDICLVNGTQIRKVS